MQFHANHVSTSTFAGDYYQAMFEADEQADRPHAPYLLIQRQFEDPDEHLCYVETHDKSTSGISFCVALKSLCMGCQLSSIAPMTIS